MTAEQLAQLQWTVLVSAALVSFLFGLIMHRTHFCTMGAISDAVVMGHFERLRQWALALVVATLGLGWMTFIGWVSPLQSVYATGDAYWLSAMVGGLLFGWGMVWSSGCGAKSLVRLGAGNYKSLVVVLVMGVVALSTLKGVLALPRVYIFDEARVSLSHGLFAGQWIADVFSFPLPVAMLASSVAASSLILFWIVKDHHFLTFRNVLTGVLVGLVICAMWWISGVLGHGLEHPETLEEFFLATTSRKMEAISLTAPVALGLDALMYFSDGTKRMTIGMVSVIGIALGAFVNAKLQGQFKWEGFSHVNDLRRHLLGAAMMGSGAVLAMGCSMGQGLSGLSTLNVVSLLATLSIVGGAFAALQWDMRHAG